jgi:hypothetical protein
MAEFCIESSDALGAFAYEGEAVITATLEWEAVDHGIGDYEYWGAKGTQHDWRMELQEASIEVALLYDEETQQEVYVDVKDPANKPLIEYWLEYIYENAEYND